MKQWDTYQWEFPHGEHPCIIISPDETCRNPDIKRVNVIGCSTHRAGRSPLAHEILLDTADGMEWSTLARCDLIYIALKTELKKRRGSVTLERRRALGRLLIRIFGLWVE